MNAKRKRQLMGLIVVLLIIGLSASLMLYALRKNISLFYAPTQIAQNEAPKDRLIRVGGMVLQGSVQRRPHALWTRFILTDYKHQLEVQTTSILPDLFREGQGVIARGRLNAAGVFIANEVLAKHDEKYMPPEVKSALKPNSEKIR